MKRFKVGAGVLALLLAVSLTFFSCDNGGGGSSSRAATYRADIVVVGLGSAGTFAALAPALVWPGVRVIAVEADYQTANALARSMGGGHGASVPVNAGGRINFGPNLINADGSVSVTFGPLTHGTNLPFTTLGANPVVDRGELGTRDRFVTTAGVLPKMDSIREAVAHSHWLRTVFMEDLGLIGPGGTGMTWAAAGGFTGGMVGANRFNAMWEDPTLNHLTQHVTRMMRTRGETLLFDSDNNIIGISARRLDTNRLINIHADKVILATGNFLWDTQSIANSTADIFTTHPNVLRFAQHGWLRTGAARMNEGYGHRMAISAGVQQYPEAHFGHSGGYFCESFMWRLPSDMGNDLQGVFMQRHFTTTPQFTMAAASGGLLVVDGSGERFFDEAGAFNANGAGGFAGNILVEHNNFPYHVIVSSDANPALTWNSPITWNWGGGARTAHVMTALNAAASLPGQVEVLRADTIAGLAALMFPAGSSNYAAARANFLATVNDYDAAIAAGDPDPEFPARADNRRVRRFRDGLAGDGPFFALKVYPSSSMGHAGVASNWRGRALRTWNDPASYIENLYVIGEMSFRGLYQPTYVAGSGIGWSWARGMIAGIDAALRLRYGVDIPSLQAPAP